MTTEEIAREIEKRWNVVCVTGLTAFGKDVISIENCNHKDCDRIGQFAMRNFPKQVCTYTACHLFRKGRVNIFC